MTDEALDTPVKKPLPYAHRGDLTQGPVMGHLLRMTLPMIWGIMAIIAVQLVDTYFISLLGDTTTLAGFSFTFPVTMIISHLVFGINIALSSVIARLLGAKQTEDAKRVVLHGLFMAFCASTLIAISTFIFLKPLFFALGADESTFPTVLEYMPIWLISSVILALPVNANSAMRAGGDTRIPAIVMTSVALVNAILDPILIFGMLGVPAMGVTGAALATLIATCCGCAIAFYFLIFKKRLVATDGLHLDTFKDSFKRLAIIAIPAGIGNIIMPFTSAVIIGLLASYGHEAVAAYGIVSRIEALAMVFVISLSLGMAPIVGQNWGAKTYNRVHEAIKLAIMFNFIWSLTIAVILGLFAKPIAGLFSQDPQVIEYTALFFWIVPITYGFGNLVMGWSSVFNAIGKPQKSFVIIFIKAIVLTLPAVYLGAALYGVVGVFIATAIVNLFAGILFHTLSRRSCRAAEEACEDA